MRKEIQLRFHNIVSKPALLCGSECWTLRQRDKSRINRSQMRFLRSLNGVTLRNRIKSEEIRKKWIVGEMIDDIKNFNWNETNMFLGCQKIDYHAKHCNVDPKEKVIWEDLTIVGNTCSCSCRSGIDYPKLRMEEEEEEEEGKLKQ